LSFCREEEGEKQGGGRGGGTAVLEEEREEGKKASEEKDREKEEESLALRSYPKVRTLRQQVGSSFSGNTLGKTQGQQCVLGLSVLTRCSRTCSLYPFSPDIHIAGGFHCVGYFFSWVEGTLEFNPQGSVSYFYLSCLTFRALSATSRVSMIPGVDGRIHMEVVAGRCPILQPTCPTERTVTSGFLCLRG
jgi:hypothetical protein